MMLSLLQLINHFEISCSQPQDTALKPGNKYDTFLSVQQVDLEKIAASWSRVTRST